MAVKNMMNVTQSSFTDYILTLNLSKISVGEKYTGINTRRFYRFSDYIINKEKQHIK